MGLDINGAKFLLYARGQGVSFAKTAMIGRQQMLLSPDDLQITLNRFGIEATKAETEKMTTGSDDYAESFLEMLGADEVVSFDASDYENASIIHDFNQPIPDEFKDRFSTVLDGGTLEHIFNYPTALKNCMEMLETGGHFLAITPANNMLGHGFYQFSPELFFRVFSAANGFELKHVIIYEGEPGGPWYDVADPDAVKERVLLTNGLSSLLLIVAKKVEKTEIFASMPQQSDYSAVWSGSRSVGSDIQQPRLSWLPLRGVFRMPLTAVRSLKLRIDRTAGMLNRRPRHFKKVDLP